MVVDIRRTVFLYTERVDMLPNTTPARAAMIAAESDASVLRAIRESRKGLRHAEPHEARSLRAKIQCEGCRNELARYTAEAERRGLVCGTGKGGRDGR